MEIKRWNGFSATNEIKARLHQTEPPNALPASWRCPGQPSAWWEVLSLSIRSSLSVMATTGMEGDLWIGSRSAGLYHSTDGGVSFTKVASVGGADTMGFGKAAPGKSFPAVFLLGSINNRHARYRSDDAGQTWVRIDDDQHQYGSADVPMIVGDPRIYGRVYVTTGGRGVIYGDINPGAK